MYELEGDVYALNLVDLEREGLVEYRYLLKPMSGGASNPSTSGAIMDALNVRTESLGSVTAPGIGRFSQGSISSAGSTSAELINELFKTLNLDVSHYSYHSHEFLWSVKYLS